MNRSASPGFENKEAMKGSAVRQSGRSNNHQHRCVSHFWTFDGLLSQSSKSSSDHNEVDKICSQSRSIKFTSSLLPLVKESHSLKGMEPYPTDGSMAGVIWLWVILLRDGNHVFCVHIHMCLIRSTLVVSKQLPTHHSGATYLQGLPASYFRIPLWNTVCGSACLRCSCVYSCTFICNSIQYISLPSTVLWVAQKKKKEKKGLSGYLSLDFSPRSQHCKSGTQLPTKPLTHPQTHTQTGSLSVNGISIHPVAQPRNLKAIVPCSLSLMPHNPYIQILHICAQSPSFHLDHSHLSSDLVNDHLMGLIDSKFSTQ